MRGMCALLLALAGHSFAASYQVAGLEQPAEILIDAWGVPHIYARTHYDAFFVQGFNAARDRLWQIDLWRRRGLGRLSEVLGARFVEQDRATRLFLYRGGMYREWLAYGSDGKPIAEAFVDGINAYVELVRENPARLPVEFTLLDSDLPGRSPYRGVSTHVRSPRMYSRCTCSRRRPSSSRKTTWPRRCRRSWQRPMVATTG